MRRRRGGRLSTFAVGDDRDRRVVVVVYLGFTKSIPFRHHYTIQAEFRSSNNIALELAGAHRGRQRRQGHRASSTCASTAPGRAGEDGDPEEGPAHPHRRHGQDPPADLPGGQLLRRHPARARRRRKALGDGGRIPVRPHEHARPARPGAHLAAGRHPDATCRRPSTSSRAGSRAAAAAATTARSSSGSRPTGTPRSSTPRCWAPSPTTSRASWTSSAPAAQAIDRNPEQLKSLVTDFNTTALAFAREQGALEQSVAELPRTLRAAMPALASLNRAFPPVRRLAREALPGVRSSGPDHRRQPAAGAPAAPAGARAELRGLVADLRPTVPSLGNLESASRAAL